MYYSWNNMQQQIRIESSVSIQQMSLSTLQSSYYSLFFFLLLLFLILLGNFRAKKSKFRLFNAANTIKKG